MMFRRETQVCFSTQGEGPQGQRASVGSSCHLPTRPPRGTEGPEQPQEMNVSHKSSGLQRFLK